MRSTKIRNDHTLSLLLINCKHISCTAVSVSSDNLKCYADCTFRVGDRLAVRAPQSVLYTVRYPAQHRGDSGVDPRVVGVSTLPAVAHDAQLGQSEDSIQYSVFNIQYSVSRPHKHCPAYLPFSAANNGPPESPWHESLPLFQAHTWILKFSRHAVFFKIL